LRLKILFHDNCFDGTASAALFTRLYREKVRGDAEIVYRGMHHGTGPVFPEGTFDADEHACVDFRYSPDPRLTWWFDHHISAFITPEDEATFRAGPSDTKFFDPSAPSCAGFISRVSSERFGLDVTPMSELIQWAEIIDAAAFASPEQAVALAEPALKLMTWIENNKDPALTERYIGRLVAAESLATLAAEPWIAEPLAPILALHERAVELLRRRITVEKAVIFFDLIDDDLPTYNKFIPYFLHPKAHYLVGLSRAPGRLKIFAGTNPWLPRPPVNIAKICERYGGGGHPVVGAVSVPEGQVERARQIASEMAAELRAQERP
jgi:hypothetical protein